MEEITSLAHLEFLETGFEISKRLAQAGNYMDHPVLVLTWGDVARVIAQTLADHGISPDRLDDEQFQGIVQDVQLVLGKGDDSAWHEMIQLSVMSNPNVIGLLEPQDTEVGEGPLTELFENATRLGDEEGYWPDAGASADLFEDF
jgi:hypothetical protein